MSRMKVAPAALLILTSLLLAECGSDEQPVATNPPADASFSMIGTWVLNYGRGQFESMVITQHYDSVLIGSIGAGMTPPTVLGTISQSRQVFLEVVGINTWVHPDGRTVMAVHLIQGQVDETGMLLTGEQSFRDKETGDPLSVWAFAGRKQ